MALTEWVSAPTEMKSTPNFAIDGILLSVIPPLASSLEELFAYFYCLFHLFIAQYYQAEYNQL